MANNPPGPGLRRCRIRLEANAMGPLSAEHAKPDTERTLMASDRHPGQRTESAIDATAEVQQRHYFDHVEVVSLYAAAYNDAHGGHAVIGRTGAVNRPGESGDQLAAGSVLAMG